MYKLYAISSKVKKQNTDRYKINNISTQTIYMNKTKYYNVT